MMKHKLLLFLVLFPMVVICQQPVIDNSITSSVNHLYAGDIRIPYSNGDVHIYNNASAIIESSTSIELLPGFTADIAEGCGQFRASINSVMGGGSQVALSNAYNYIYTRIPNQPVITESALNLLSLQDKQLSVNYFDGLVRPWQNIKIGYTSDFGGKDLVQPRVSDNNGLESKIYMAYPSSGSNGSFNTNAENDAIAFHANPTNGIVASQHAFADKMFERSPLKRLLEAGSFGEDFQVDINHHTNRFNFKSNQQNEIPIWKCTTNGATSEVGGSVEYYLSDQLFIEKAIDGNSDLINGYNGNTKTIYKDIQGKTICEKSYVRTGSTGDSYDFTAGGTTATGGTYKNYFTFYIYDDFNRLKYVIPPAASDYLINHSQYSFTEADAIFNQYVFAYRYDARGRNSEKKTPGQDGWNLFLYNNLNKLAGTCTPNQQTSSGLEWTFIKYDLLGRVIGTGKYVTSVNLAQPVIQSLIDVAPYNWEIRDNTNPTGYSSRVFPSATDISYFDQLLYYDDYDFSFDATLAGRSYQFYSQNQRSFQTTGLATASKISYNGTFLSSVKFYNEDGFLIQQQTQNHLNGWDTYNFRYDYQGKTIVQERKHEALSNPPINIKTRYSYDHEGHLKDIYKKINTDPEIHLVNNNYNDLGQLIQKKLNVDVSLTYGCLQQIDFRYNERGWLTSINNSALIDDNGVTNDDDFDAFGEQITYANIDDLNLDPAAHNSKVGLPQWNGNISSISWKSKAPESSASDYAENAYIYRYDELNRMTVAYYCAGNPGLNNWYDKKFDWYNEKLHYDINGNIGILSRTYDGQMADHLSYAYNGNKLMDVNDAVSGTGFGFNDQFTLNDYSYDANGNLTKDENKFITSLVYNWLNLPTSVRTATQQLEYKYDGSGSKHVKMVDGNNPHDYVDGIEYENNDLLSIATEEGRIRLKDPSASNTSAYVYDYFLKDHLGNIRSVVSNEQVSQQMAATMESQNAVVEEQLFYNLNTTRENLPPGYPIDNTYLPNLKTGNVNAGEGKPIGAATVLHLNEGDQISIDVKYWVPQLPGASNSVNINSVVNQLAGVFFLQPSNGFSIAGNDQVVRQTWADNSFINNTGVSGFLNSFLNAPPHGGQSNPLAYLTYLYYDEDFNFIEALSGAQQTTLINQLGSLSVTDFVASKNGYLYVYVSNEESIEVYFDNLNIVHKKSALKERTDYYAFGLAIDDLGNSSMNGLRQDYKFNGKELQHELDYNVDDFGARHYDGLIGRWLGIDTLAEKYIGISPYAFVANNPINLVDIDGREIKPLTFNDIAILQSTFDQYRSLFSYTTFPSQQNVGNASGVNGTFNLFTTKTSLGLFQRQLNASNFTPQQRQEATALYNVLSSTDILEVGIVNSNTNSAATQTPPTQTNNVEIRGTTNANAISLFNMPNKTDQIIQSNMQAETISGTTAGGATYGYYPQPQNQVTPAPRGGTFVGVLLINTSYEVSYTRGQVVNTLPATQAITESIQNISSLGIVR